MADWCMHTFNCLLREKPVFKETPMIMFVGIYFVVWECYSMKKYIQTL